MNRLMRVVDAGLWVVSEELSAGRRLRLLDPPTCEELLQQIAVQSTEAAADGRVRLHWKDCSDHPGAYGQLVAQIPLIEDTFDQLFNGRSGYRAQYYLSPEEGVLFNRDIVQAVLPAVSQAYIREPPSAPFSLVEQSLLAPHAKMWILDERASFDAAVADVLNPPRWVENGATRGRKAPLPAHLTIEVKGSLIDHQQKTIYVSDMKLDRPMDLFNRGYT